MNRYGWSALAGVAAIWFGAAAIWFGGPAIAQVFSRAIIKNAVTVTGTSAQAVAAHTRTYLAILNQSTTDTVTCNFGAAAVIGAAGAQAFPPLSGFVWDNALVPNNSINCISSGTSTPLTIYE